jgi:queuine tRNA-ribosyltransferase
MSFDECIPYPSDKEYAEASTERTLRWAKRGLEHHTREDQALFGIVQGSSYRDLREHAAKELAKMDFPGYSIGGTSIGEPKEVCLQMVEDAVSYLPLDKPRYLMGVGSSITSWGALSAASICSTASCRPGSPVMGL